MILILVALAGCANNSPQDTLSPVGENARKAYDLYKPVFFVAVAVFVLVEGMLLFAILRYRQRSDRDAPVQVHGNTPLEVLWTIIPAVILLGVAFPTIKTIFDFARKPRGNVLEVTVVGHLWWWEFQYPNVGPGGASQVITGTELHIPAGRPVHLTLESNEVIHSFWVPKLAGKQDVVPGRHNMLTIKVATPGTYSGQCAEYCGVSHANMRLRVVVQPETEFQDWISQQLQPAATPTDDLALKGKDLFENGIFAGGNQCSGCHTISGTKGQGKVGPNLTHVASRSVIAGGTLQNPAQLSDWLHDPPGEKPGSIMPQLKLTGDQIDALVAYLKTLH